MSRRPVPRLVLVLALSLATCVVSSHHAFAQDAGTPQTDAGAPPGDAGAPAADDDDGQDDDDQDDDDDDVRLRPPQLDQPDVDGDDDDGDDGQDGDGQDGDGQDGDGDTVPTPEDAAARLAAQGEEATGSSSTGWTTPQRMFVLHGYLRVRPELWHDFALGRDAFDVVEPPFTNYRPLEDGFEGVRGGCGDEPSDDETPSRCDQSTLAGATMRLRLQPEIRLTEDIRVGMQIDVFDNLVLGSTPDGYTNLPLEGGGGYGQPGNARSPWVPLRGFAGTQQPPQYGQNSWTDSIIARRVWGEVRNRSIGLLRFGRMESHWGLGMLTNGGQGLDSDYQSDVDRILFATRPAGITVALLWDFPSEGPTTRGVYDLAGHALDASQLDDVNQYAAVVARRQDPQEQETALQRGEIVWSAGLYFVYRNQFLSTEGVEGLTQGAGTYRSSAGLVRREAEAFIPDVWFQLRWRRLRIELEAAMIAGSIRNTQLDSFVDEDFNLMMFGGALEVEYRLLEDKLFLGFNTGFASGDPDVEGISSAGGLQPQQAPEGRDPDDTISTFRFHPNYRVDLILWRTLYRQVAGAYYFRPSIGYDFVRGAYGNLLGARLDIIYSRATEPLQTRGNSADLGIEVNASLYYRSESGPESEEDRLARGDRGDRPGFHAILQYGILFPMDGLGWLEGETMGTPARALDMPNAQTLRLVLGIVY